MGNLHTSHLLDQKLWKLPVEGEEKLVPLKTKTETPDAA
jgi:hypothetical protein